jgi:hypothetical protein
MKEVGSNRKISVRGKSVRQELSIYESVPEHVGKYEDCFFRFDAGWS